MKSHLAAGALTESSTWPTVQFRRIAQLVTTRNVNADEDLLSVSSTGTVTPRDGDGRQASSDSTIRNGWVASPGDLVVNPMWLIGGGVAVTAIRGAVSPDYRVYRFAPGVEPRYMHHLLRTPEYLSQYRLYTRADTTFDRRVSKSDFHEMPVLLPPLEDQRRIAGYLDSQVGHLNRVIEQRQREARLAEELQSAGLAETFFDASLPTTRLAHVALVEHGRQRSPEHEQGSHMVPYIRSANVKDGEFALDDVKEMNFTPEEQARYRLREGDVLVTEAAGSPAAIGASAVWAGEISGVVCFQNHLLRLRPQSEDWSADYLGWWARASFAAGAMRVWATGANILNLGSESLRAMRVPVRTPAQQMALTQECEALTRRCAALKGASMRSAALLREYRDALVTGAVTGQFDVTTARAVGGVAA